MKNFKQIGEGMFLGPQPSEHDLAEAKQHGIVTVVDLRMPAETATPNANLAEAHGLNYVNVPIDKTALSAQQIVAFEQAIAQTDGPHLLHCATGARAALMLSLCRAEQQGWSAERALEEAAAMGFNLQSSDAFVEFVKAVRAP